jgi:hypothetical protein
VVDERGLPKKSTLGALTPLRAATPALMLGEPALGGQQPKDRRRTATAVSVRGEKLVPLGGALRGGATSIERTRRRLLARIDIP